MNIQLDNLDEENQELQKENTNYKDSIENMEDIINKKNIIIEDL